MPKRAMLVEGRDKEEKALNFFQFELKYLLLYKTETMGLIKKINYHH